MLKNRPEQNNSPKTGGQVFQWIDKQELMQELHISNRALQHLRSSGKLPFYRLGGKIYYKITDVDALIERNKCVGVKENMVKTKKETNGRIKIEKNRKMVE